MGENNKPRKNLMEKGLYLTVHTIRHEKMGRNRYKEEQLSYARTGNEERIAELNFSNLWSLPTLP